MKKSRFFSVFLLLVLLTGLCVTPNASALEDPDIQAGAALLMDAHTGAVAYAKNEHKEMYPASLTKIMTGLLVFEAIEAGRLTLDTPITTSASALEGLPRDGSTANIKEGEVLTVEQLLYCMMVVSANEACNILAEAVSGSVDAFVASMNAKAQALNCENTHFVNPNGLHDDQHYSTAWDLYLITKAAMEHEDFMRIADTGDIKLPPTNLTPDGRSLHSTNYLISVWRSRGYINKNAHGIKTGSTDEAGHCLISSATKGTLSFISVLLDCERLTLEDGEIRTMSFYETNRLFDWAFNSFSYQTILTTEEFPREVAVSLSKIEHVTVHPARDVEVLFPVDLTPEELERTITLHADPVEAPVKGGQVLGTIELSYDGKVYAKEDLLALNDVEASGMLVFLRDAKLFLAKPAVKITGIVLAVLILAVLVWRLLFARRRYRYGRSVNRGYHRSSYHGRKRR